MWVQGSRSSDPKVQSSGFNVAKFCGDDIEFLGLGVWGAWGCGDLHENSTWDVLLVAVVEAEDPRSLDP